MYAERLKAKRWEPVSPVTENHKEAQVATLLSDTVDFETRTITRDKRGHFIVISASSQESVTMLTMYMPNDKGSKHTK